MEQIEKWLNDMNIVITVFLLVIISEIILIGLFAK